jgi:hypothetical protein
MQRGNTRVGQLLPSEQKATAPIANLHSPHPWATMMQRETRPGIA